MNKFKRSKITIQNSLKKKLLNLYLELKGNIRVFVRCRPILPIDFKAYEGTKESFD